MFRCVVSLSIFTSQNTNNHRWPKLQLWDDYLAKWVMANVFSPICVHRLVSFAVMLLAVRLKWRRSVNKYIQKIHSTENNLSLDSDDDFRSGCRNISHHYRQQSFSGLHSPGRSNYTITCYPRFQTIYCIIKIMITIVMAMIT